MVIGPEAERIVLFVVVKHVNFSCIDYVSTELGVLPISWPKDFLGTVLNIHH